MEIIWKIVKGIIATCLLLIFLIILYIQYSEHKLAEQINNSSIIQSLNKMEAENKHGDIWIKLIKEIQSVSDEDRDLIIKWTNKRLSDGNGPYYYVLALYYMKSAQNVNNKFIAKTIARRALEYFSAGQLIYRADASRCNDPTSIQAVPIIESSIFGSEINKLLNENHELRSSILPWALEQEEKTKNRKPSVWICAHGIKNFTGKNELLSEDQWDIERLKIRKQYSEFMTKL